MFVRLSLTIKGYLTYLLTYLLVRPVALYCASLCVWLSVAIPDEMQSSDRWDRWVGSRQAWWRRSHHSWSTHRHRRSWSVQTYWHIWSV